MPDTRLNAAATGMVGLVVVASAGSIIALGSPKLILILAGSAAYALVLLVVLTSPDPRRVAVLAMACGATTFSWSGIGLTAGMTLAEVAPLGLLPLALLVPPAARPTPGPRHVGALAVPVLITTGGLVAATAPGAQLRPVIAFAFSTIALAVTLFVLRPDRNEAGVILTGLLTGILISTVLGLVLPHGPTDRAVGLTTHSNQFAMAAVMGLPVAAYLMRGPGWPRLLRTLVVVILVAGLLESGSRSGLIGLAVLVAAWSYHRYRLPGLTAATLAAIALFEVLPKVPGVKSIPTLYRLFDPAATEASDTGRLALFNAEVRLFDGMDYVIGTGFVGERLPHNIMLMLLGGYGLLGLLAFAWMVVAVLAPIVRRSSPPFLVAMALACSGFLGVVALNNLLGASFFWLVVFLALFTHGVSSNDSSTSPEAEAGAGPARPLEPVTGEPTTSVGHLP